MATLEQLNEAIIQILNSLDGYGSSSLVQVSATDTTPQYLQLKITAGDNISIDKNSVGGVENLSISAVDQVGSVEATSDHKFKISATDTTANYAVYKIIGGDNIEIAKSSNGGVESLTVNAFGFGLDDVIAAFDGYASLPPAASAADGYIAFFTGATGIAGDNDLYYDRANGRLGLHAGLPTEKFEAYPDQEATAIIGRTRIGSTWTTDTAAFSHYDYNTSTEFALKQNGSGQTILNSTNYSLIFATEGAGRWYIDYSSSDLICNGTYQIRADDNSSDATAPGYSFLLDEDTGMFQAAANEIGFTTGGTERVRIDSSGYLGIATTNPLSPFHLYVDADQNLRIRQNAGLLTISALNDASSAIVPLSLQANEIYFTTGSGTGSVYWGINSDGVLYSNSGRQITGSSSATVSAPNYSFTGDTDTGMYRAAADTLGFATAGIARLTIDSSGVVSIKSLLVNGTDLSVAVSTIIESLDGYEPSAGLQDQFDAFAAAQTSVNTDVLSELDSYQSQLDILNAFSTAQSNVNTDMLSELDSYQSQLDILNAFSTAQSSVNTDVLSELDSYQSQLDVLSAYDTAQTSFNTDVLSELDSYQSQLDTLNAFSTAQSSVNTDVISELDSYQSQLTTHDTLFTHQSSVNTDVLSELDSYQSQLDILNAFSTAQSSVNTDVLSELDSYQSQIDVHNILFGYQTQWNTTVLDDLDGYAVLPPSGSAADGYVAFFTGSTGLAGDNDLFWDRANNRLGIGTNSPSTKLEINGVNPIMTIRSSTTSGLAAIDIGQGGNGNRYAYLDLVGDDTYTDYGFRILRDNAGANADTWMQHRGTGDLILWTTEAAPILFSTSSAERMRIDSSGQVGIGCTPSCQLEINDSGACVVKMHAGAGEDSRLMVGSGGSGNRFSYLDLIGDDTYTNFGLRLIRNNGGVNTTSDIIHRGIGGMRFISEDAGYITLSTSNTERMRIDSSGQVGIGSTGPDTLLEIQHAAADAHHELIKLTEDAWGASSGKYKSIVWEDTANNVAAIGAQYNSGTGIASIDFHSIYNSGYKTESDVVMRVMGDGKVGIGITPAAIFNSYSTTEAQGRFNGYATQGGVNTNAGEINIGYMDSGVGARIQVDGAVTGDLIIENIFDNSAGDIRFRTRTNGTPVEGLTILGDGNVIIENDLEVKGELYTGNINSDALSTALDGYAYLSIQQQQDSAITDILGALDGYSDGDGYNYVAKTLHQSVGSSSIWYGHQALAFPESSIAAAPAPGFIIPRDYSSGGRYYIKYIVNGTSGGNAYFRTQCYSYVNGSVGTVDSSYKTISITSSSNTLTELVSFNFDSNIGDEVSVKLTRYPANAADTCTDDIYVLGAYFDYIAAIPK